MNPSGHFEALVAAYADDLYRYAYWLCRDCHQAEDLVQETLLRSWRGFGSVRAADAVKAWLLTTLRREFLRALAPGEQPRMLSLDDEDGPLTEADLPHYLPSMDDEIEVRRALERLPRPYCEVLILQVYFGYSTKELAAIVGTTEAAVANRLLRARKALALEQAADPANPTQAVVIPLKRRQQGGPR